MEMYKMFVVIKTARVGFIQIFKTRFVFFYLNLKLIFVIVSSSINHGCVFIPKWLLASLLDHCGEWYQSRCCRGHGTCPPRPCSAKGSRYKRNRCPNTYLGNSCDKTFFWGAEAARANTGESRPPPALCTPESQEPGNVAMCLATGSWQTRSEGFWDGKIVLDHRRGHRVLTRVFQYGDFSRLGSESVTLEKNGWKDVNLLALNMGEAAAISGMAATARGWKNKDMGLSTSPPEKKTDWAWILGPGDPIQIMYLGLWFLKH